jgi:ATP-dependent DNA helicase RecG
MAPWYSGAVQTQGGASIDGIRVFVSSVQKELEDERLIVQNLLTTDPFLSSHCVPVLFEYEPASPEKALEGCLTCLDGCQVYLAIIGAQEGTRVGAITITHAEYRRAKEQGLPVLAFIKGEREIVRQPGTRALLDELDADGPKYKRFGNVIELQKEVRAALAKLLRETYGIEPSSDENEIARRTIEATSAFESQCLTQIELRELDHRTLRRLIAAAEGVAEDAVGDEELRHACLQRGLVWHDSESGSDFATGAGIVFAAKNPSSVFPQCRILADAYAGIAPDGTPRDHEDIREPLPRMVDRAMAFVSRNTRHPMRIVGLNRVVLDEYPVEALREALVNAVAHRQYEDAGRRIMLEVFADRIVVSSPGYPPSPITLAALRSGRYRPCSRNPVLAQSLSYFHRIEERGSGFRRMRDSMLNHGLDTPVIGTDTGYFQVTFPGPGDHLERIQVLPSDSRLLVSAAIETRLNERQKGILGHVLESGSVTRRWCVAEFEVAPDTAGRDLKGLVDLNLLRQIGMGRAARYELASEAGRATAE